MPRKKNNRKAIQAAKRDAEPKPRKAIIAHTPYGGSGAALSIAIAMALPGMVSVDVLDETKER